MNFLKKFSISYWNIYFNTDKRYMHHSESSEFIAHSNVVVRPYFIDGYYFNGGPSLNALPEIGRIKRNVGFADINLATDDESEAITFKLFGNFLWGGPLFLHFGHIMTESIHRLYAYNPEIHDGIIFAVSSYSEQIIKETNIPTFLKSILELYSIPIEKVILIREPTLIENLIYAESGSALGCGPSDWYFDILNTLEERIQQRFSESFINLINSKHRKIFLSRAHIIKQGTFMGESYFADLMLENGFKLFIPEQHEILEQAMILKHAEQIVFIEGSGIYASELLASLKANLIMIPRRKHEPNYIPHLSPKSNFNIVGDIDALHSLPNNSGHYAVESPGISLNPESIFNDLQRMNCFLDGAVFSLDKFYEFESIDLFNFAEHNHLNYRRLIEARYKLL